MTIQSQIEALENLAQLDAVIAAIEQEIQSEREAFNQKKALVAQLDARIEKATRAVEEMERVRNELVQDARQISQQMERSREKLGRSRTEREVNAAQREIEELRKLYKDREIEIQKLTGLVDQARQDMTTHTTERAEIANAVGSSEGTIMVKLRDLETQVGEKATLRQTMTRVVQPVMLRRYETIRKKLGGALTYTQDGTCAVCHMTLPPMMFQKLRRGDGFDQCPSCHRILYFRMTLAAEVADTPSGA